MSTDTTQLALATEQLGVARAFTEKYLDGLEPHEWFWQPGDGINHVAWQVAHLAFAQYALCLKRVRGERDEDEQLIPAEFIRRYGRGTTPSSDPSDNASLEEIRSVFDRVFAQTLQELSGVTDAELDVPAHPPSTAPHPMFSTKLGAIEWCGQHEFLHCGQIVLLRRLMGKEPTW